MIPSQAIEDLDSAVVGDMARRHLRGPHHARARLLQLLLREPELTTTELAGLIDRSPSTVRYYLSLLREGGLDALMHPLMKSHKLTWQQRELLVAEVRRGSFASYGEIIGWVEQQFEVSYSVSGLRRFLSSHFNLVRRLLPEPDHTPVIDLTFSPQFPTFLNMLPVTTDYVAWSRGLQDAFRVLFPALERGKIVVLLNRSAAIAGEMRPNVGTTVLDIVSDGAAGARRGRRSRRSIDNEHDSVLESVLGQMEDDGVDTSLFHPPVDFVARLAPDSWVGRIILFFPNNRPDPRREVELRLELLRPFLCFCLSDGVARDIVGHPQNRPFQIAVNRLAGNFELTPRERQVIALYLSGSSPEEIGDDLTISPLTVRNHIRNIHNKTSTSRHHELFRLLWNI